MDALTMILIAWAGATIIAFTLLLMWYVIACYRVWKTSDNARGFLAIAVRALAATVVYGLRAGVSWALLIGFGLMFGLGPEAAMEVQLPTELAGRAAFATFLLPLTAPAWRWSLLPVLPIIVLAGFFLLGLVTMLPGLGYGSKVLWGAVGLAGFVVYLFVSIAVLAESQNLYAWSVALIFAGVLLALAIMRLMLWLWPVQAPLTDTHMPEAA